MSAAAEATALKAAVDAHYAASLSAYVDKVTSETDLLLNWIDYLRKSAKNKNAVRLLDAVQGAIIETAGCLSLGLVRPAIFSVRIQLELLVAWIYFEDHAVEWSRIEGGKDFPMRSFYLKYMSENGSEFSTRMKLLEDKRQRKHADPYGILSVYVHSTSPYSAPQVGPLAALVFPSAKCDECVELQRDVAEYLTDILAAWNISKWHDLPELIRANMTARLPPKDLSKLCS